MLASSHRINVAIVGAGFISDYHASGLKAAGGAHVSTLVGRRREATQSQAGRLGIDRVETDYRAVLDDPTIDAIVVASPDDTHERIAIDALDAGKSVLVQKPMALDSTQCSNIIEAARSSRATLTVSFMHRYFPEVVWLRQMLMDGRLGDIHSIRIRNATPGADWADWFYKPGKVAGGVVMQLGVHGIDLCRHLVGEILEVQASTRTARANRVLADGATLTHCLEDNAVALYGLAGGTQVSHEMSYTELRGCDRFRLELYGDGGTVWLRSERGAAALFAPAITDRHEWVAPELVNEPPGRAHHRHWLSILRGECPPDDTAQAGRQSVAVGEAIYAAAHSGARIHVEGTGEREAGQ